MKIVNIIGNRDVSVEAPLSKAHTLRALVIGSLVKGQSIIHSALLGGEGQPNLIIRRSERVGCRIILLIANSIAICVLDD